MYKSFAQVQEFVNGYAEALREASRDGGKLVLAPSFESLQYCQQAMSKTIVLAGQDCSTHESGPYTGQVSARSLQEIGCTYCIVGHHEVLQACPEDIQAIFKKVEVVCKAGLMPLVCFGERVKCVNGRSIIIQAFNESIERLLVLAKQLRSTIGIVYEPVWAIGTGAPAAIEDISCILEHIRKVSIKHQVQDYIKLLYGAGVNVQTITAMYSIDVLDGVLIGSAGCDGDELLAILNSYPKSQH